MKHRVVAAVFLVAIMGLAVSGSAKADGMDTFTYVFDGNTYVWQLPPDPPSSLFATDPGVLVEFQPLSYTLNMVTQTPAILDFFDGPAPNGGFQLSLSTTNIILDAVGDQIFGGTDAMPTFAPGSFKLSDDVLNSNSVTGTGTLTITGASVPEPGSLLLIGTGLLALFGIARKKLLS